MESKEAAPEQSRTHLRQAIMALGMGIGAWVLGLVGFVVAVAGGGGERRPTTRGGGDLDPA